MCEPHGSGVIKMCPWKILGHVCGKFPIFRFTHHHVLILIRILNAKSEDCIQNMSDTDLLGHYDTSGVRLALVILKWFICKHPLNFCRPVIVIQGQGFMCCTWPKPA